MRKAIVLAVGLMLALAACDGGDEEAGGPGTPASESATPDLSVSTSPPVPTDTVAGTEVSRVSDVAFQEDADGTRHVMNIYAPATTGGPWPVAVMIGSDWAEDVARRGVVVFQPDGLLLASGERVYDRYGPPWPSLKAAIANLTASTGESACAVRFAVAEAERYGGDPSNLTLFGHSVGANFASVVAFGDLEVPEGCIARSGSVVPDNLVLHDGQWLIIDGSGVWDQALRRDSQLVLDVHTPWSYLVEGTRMPVHILDSSDPAACRTTQDMDRWLPLTDPSGYFRPRLEQLGAFEDGQLCAHELQLLLAGELRQLGYRVAFDVLPGRAHVDLTEEDLQILGDAILRQT